MTKVNQDGWWLGLLGVFIFAVYLLLLPGHFHSVDESAMYVAAHNAWQEGNLHTNQMAYSLWAIRPGEAVTMLSPTGDIYTKKSPLMVALMIPFVWLGLRLPWLSSVQAVLLLGPLLTAVTAVLLCRLARQMGYGRRVALAAALLFAFTTMALPYAQTVFSEPLAALGLLLLVGSIGLERKRPLPPTSLLLAGTGLALAVGSNIVYLLLAPFVVMWLLYGQSQATRNWPATIATFAAPLLLLGLGLLYYNRLRFGHWLETGYHFAPGQEGFTSPLWWGISGLLLSPARGLIWYSPLTLLGVWGLYATYQQRPRPAQLVAQLVGVIILFHLIAFGAWWEWWGGYGWGPRFLLPLLPLLLLTSLPLLNRALAGERWLQGIVALCAVAGLVVQFAGTAVDFNRYEIFLDDHFPAPADQPLRYHHDPELVWRWADSPIIAHWQLWLDGERQPLWWRTVGQSHHNLQEIPHQIRTAQQPGDVVINLVPELLYDLLDQPGLPPVYGLPYRVAVDDPQARQLFERVKSNADRIWLITWYQAGDPDNWYEQELRREWASVQEMWADDLRLLLVARPPASEARSGTARFGPIQLRHYDWQMTETTLFVTLTWVAEQPIHENFVNFVHILDESGNLLAQQDRQPWAGYRPTSSWQPGEPLTDRFAFPRHPLPADGWQIATGWYSWPSLERLPLTVSGEQSAADQYRLP